MPSKIQHELNKVTGNLTKEDKIIGNTLADINVKITSLTKTITTLETDLTNSLKNQQYIITENLQAKLNAKLNNSGGIITGNLTINNDLNINKDLNITKNIYADNLDTDFQTFKLRLALG